MSFIHIKRKTIQKPEGAIEVFAVPAVAITSAQGKILIPNPAGNEACVFQTLEEAEQAVQRAGFDYIYEGKKTYALTKNRDASRISPSEASPLESAIPILLERLKDREPTVIANTAFALGELRALEATHALSDLLGHEDFAVRKEVAEAYAKLGRNALSVLINAFNQARRRPEKNASHARLTIMTAYLEMVQTHRDLIPDLLPQAVEALNDESWLVRAQAALVVGHAARLLRDIEN